jgi:hypothetical protein
VASVFGRKFLGYSLWVAAGGVVKRKVAAKVLYRTKPRALQRSDSMLQLQSTVVCKPR